MRCCTLLLASALLACTTSRPPTQLPPGQWGGDHVSLAVTMTNGSLQFDCAHGTLDEAPLLDPEGQFDLHGTYVREHGGPIRDGEPEDRHPAVYFGRLEGSRVTFSIRLTDDGANIGPYAAQLGQPPRIVRCL